MNCPHQLPAALEAAHGAEVMAGVEVEIQDWCNAKGCFFQTQSELQLQCLPPPISKGSGYG